MKKFVLAVTLVIGFTVRLYRVNASLADWHSWRQADTAAVARNFIKEGIDLLHPRFDDLSNIPSGKENPEGWRFVEFPIYNAAHAISYRVLDTIWPERISFEMVGRLVSIFSSLIASVFLYLIVKRLLGWKIGFFAMFFFLFLPYNIYYSRVILPEPMMVSMFLASIYFLVEAHKKRIFWILSLILAAGAVLVKPYAIFVLAPSWLVIFGNNLLRTQNKKRYILYTACYIFLSFFPFIVWRLWMRQFPEGIPANRWLFNLGGIRFRPAWWRWLFAERLAKLILGYWGTLLLCLGILLRIKVEKELLFYSWLIGIFAYLSVFARGNVQHDYYQIIIIPVISVFLAKGAAFLIKPPKEYFYRILSAPLLIVVLVFMFGFSWYHIRDFYQINHPEIVEAGKAADKLLPQTAKVIAPYNGDTAFLYQTKRPGWPAMTHSLEEMVKFGATHYVSVNFDSTTKELMQKCLVLKQTPRWVIVDLRTCKEK